MFFLFFVHLCRHFVFFLPDRKKTARGGIVVWRRVATFAAV